MAILQYKDSQGNWVEIAEINQVIEVEASKEWKEIELTGVLYESSFGDMWEYDCTAAGINLLENENWILVCQTSEYGKITGNYAGASTLRPLSITPILARLQGEDMSYSSLTRIGIYLPDVDEYGFGGFGSALYTNKGYSRTMIDGRSGTGTHRTYENTICVPKTYIQQTAKLIYLE